MATNYPTSLDSYSDVATGDTIQATTTNNVQDAVEALQSKVGVDSSAVTTSVDYKLRNLPTQESDLNLGGKAIIAWDGWLADSRTWTYATATSFTIAGVDVTAQFPKGTRIRYKQGGSYEYGTVASTSFSTNTTVNLAPNDDYALANAAITDAGYSYAASPVGYPDGFSFTPTGDFVTVGNGTISGKFWLKGHLCTARYVFILGSTSVVSSGVGFIPPVAMSSDMVSHHLGEVRYLDNSASTSYVGGLFPVSTTRLRWYAHDASATYATQSLCSSTVPFTWASGDRCYAIVTYEIA